jgi:hypothetical protein
VSAWKPLSKRDDPAALEQLATPHDGLPPWLAAPVLNWVHRTFVDPQWSQPRPRPELLQRVQLAFRLDPSLPDFQRLGLNDLWSRMAGDQTFALDVVDFVLHHVLKGVSPLHVAPTVYVVDLMNILQDGGSAWEVTSNEDNGFELSRRAVGPIRLTIADLPPESRAARHLTTAWNRLSGRSPDVSVAYREAVRAVEAAAKPVVLPANPKATLGTMIAALRDKPEKWTTTLGTVDGVRLMMESVWQGQLDRHGTDDETVPLNVSAEEADAAVTICITLVRLFVGGHVRTA